MQSRYDTVNLAREAEVREIRERYESILSEKNSQLDMEVKSFRVAYERAEEVSAASAFFNLSGTLLTMLGALFVGAATYHQAQTKSMLWLGYGMFGAGVMVLIGAALFNLIRRRPPAHIQEVLKAARGYRDRQPGQIQGRPTPPADVTSH